MKIRRVSAMSIALTIVVGVLFSILAFYSNREFRALQTTTNQYIVCEQAAKELQDGSNYLAEQARLFAVTGRMEYMDRYFYEARVTQRRENAVVQLRQYFDGTDALASLQAAMDCSKELMNTEYYAMRLILEGESVAQRNWPDVLMNVQLSDKDQQLNGDQKLRRAQELLHSDDYQASRTEIDNNVEDCMNNLTRQTRNHQSRAVSVFTDMFRKMEIGYALLVVMMLVICIMVRRLVVAPLLRCNESIRKNENFPLVGAQELQLLASTYNQVLQENQEAQQLIRHKAEHDALTDLLNRGSFDKLLKIHENSDVNFALIIADVDYFKQVNDTCGHAAGDETLKKIAGLLTTAFRTIDYVCRLGGDEFAIIMVEMTSDLSYTIREKIDSVNEILAKDNGPLPKVSLSVGAAFADRKNPTDSIYRDADAALYYRKRHGKAGCNIYGEDPSEPMEPEASK